MRFAFFWQTLGGLPHCKSQGTCSPLSLFSLRQLFSQAAFILVHLQFMKASLYFASHAPRHCGFDLVWAAASVVSMANTKGAAINNVRRNLFCMVIFLSKSCFAHKAQRGLGGLLFSVSSNDISVL